MTNLTTKKHIVLETKLGEYSAQQPCSGIKEAISHVHGIGMGFALPGDEPKLPKTS
jgi:hypothetical protein